MDAPNHAEKYWLLAEKILNGTITPEEESIFIEWYKALQDEPVEIPASFASAENELKERMFRNINIRNEKASISHFKNLKYAAAASVIITISVMAFYFRQGTKPPSSIAQAPAPRLLNHHIIAGGNKAILSLGDGSQIVLDSAANGELSHQGNATLLKNNGHLTYRPEVNAAAENVYNAISTPMGGQYQVSLSDGTIVWLNAASSLKFPATFIGKERIVELNGEAYFEVAKNASRPFKVKANDMEISVLGTHFNVKAYDDESETKTTLIEGSIKLTKQNSSVTLIPGQEAHVNNSAPIRVLNDADTSLALAWKNGLFEFDDNIQEIMRQVSRWYNVEIVYEGTVTDRSFGATIARKENIADVLQLLEMTGSIHFKIDGRKIIVMP